MYRYFYIYLKFNFTMTQLSTHPFDRRVIVQDITPFNSKNKYHFSIYKFFRLSIILLFKVSLISFSSNSISKLILFVLISNHHILL